MSALACQRLMKLIFPSRARVRVRVRVCVCDLETRKRDSLLQLDHLCHNMLNRGRSIEPMGVPEVNYLQPESFEAFFTGSGHICGVAAEPKTRGKLDGAELCGKEDILALLGIQGKPFADDSLSIALQGKLQISNVSYKAM